MKSIKLKCVNGQDFTIFINNIAYVSTALNKPDNAFVNINGEDIMFEHTAKEILKKIKQAEKMTTI